MGKRKQKSGMVTGKTSIISMGLLILALFVCAFPFYVMIVGAFKNNTALESAPPDLNPFVHMNLDSFRYVLKETEVILWFKNSLVLAVSVSVITMIVAAMAGYSFAKFKSRILSLLFGVVLATMALPQTMLLVPNFLVAKTLHLNNTMIGTILTSVAPPFGIFLCRQFMKDIPDELLEAAELDGCGEFYKFIRIVIPLSLPAFGALFIFTFLGVWNDFLWQSIMLNSQSLTTLAIGIQKVTVSSMLARYSYQFALSFISTIPIFIVFFSCQKLFIKGISSGAVKG